MYSVLKRIGPMTGKPKIKINLYLDRSALAKLQVLSEKTGATVGGIIRKFVDAGLKKGSKR